MHEKTTWQVPSTCKLAAPVALTLQMDGVVGPGKLIQIPLPAQRRFCQRYTTHTCNSRYHIGNLDENTMMVARVLGIGL